MILGLSGKAGSGKDTVAALLGKRTGAVRVAFADKLKAAVGAVFDFTHEQMYDAAKKEEIDPFWEETPRRVLQEVGQHMRKLDSDIWVKAALRSCTDTSKDYVITDVRYPNEADAIVACGGKVIRIYRPDRRDLADAAAAQHTSETAMYTYL